MFVTLFNLQGAHRLSRRNLMITHRFRFVKSFFKFFQTFFAPSFAAIPLLSQPGLAADLIILPHRISFVKHFFKFFQTFFAPDFGLFGAVPCAPRVSPLAERLLILAKHLPLVNTFFQKFRLFSPQLFPQLYLLLSPLFHHYICHFWPISPLHGLQIPKTHLRNDMGCVTIISNQSFI